MATSQNGWNAGTPAQIGGLNTNPVPGTDVRLPQGVRNGDVATVLHYVAEQFHKTVEPLHAGWCWGYHYKKIEDSSTLSNHASGTAIDLNAPAHPMGKRNTFNGDKRAAIRRILDFCEGVVRWGGDYQGRPDDMHFEIVKGAGDVARIAGKIRNAGQPHPQPNPPAPAPSGTWVKGKHRPELRRGSKGPDVEFLQRMIGGLTPDGDFGPKTEARVRWYQRMRGIGADGIVGPRTWGEINKM
jgi:peptidoglycan hydrolase-like protein with peptidoglycan-binding domain